MNLPCLNKVTIYLLSIYLSRLPKGAASKGRVRAWIGSQEVGRYMQTPPPKEVFAHFTEDRPNFLHQADLIYLPHDRPGQGRKLYKYALTLVDVASRFKAGRPLTSKLADEAAKAFTDIYTTGPLTWPNSLMVDDGNKFKGAVSKLMEKHGMILTLFFKMR